MRSSVVALLLVVLSSVALADTTDIAKLTKDREATAATIYSGVVAEWKGGKRTIDDVARWSIHWLDAALDAGTAVDKAFDDHLQRMVAAEKAEQSFVKAGLGSTTDAAIATYYRTEAQLWKARGKKS